MKDLMTWFLLATLLIGVFCAIDRKVSVLNVSSGVAIASGVILYKRFALSE